MDTFLFYLFSTVMIGGALGVLFVKDYVNVAMSMLCSTLGLAGMLFLTGAYLLALLVILVYAGAIMVLFLFTIMITGEDSSDNSKTCERLFMIGLLTVSCFMIFYFTKESQEFISNTQVGECLSAKSMAALMFTKYALHFQIAGVLLLVAMVAVIVIAKDSRSGSERK